MTDNPPAGIHPLRERLAELYLDREYDEGDTWVSLIGAHPGVRATCYGEAVAQCAVIAAWLREEAEAQRRSDAQAFVGIPTAALALTRLADAIYPKGAHDGQ